MDEHESKLCEILIYLPKLIIFKMTSSKCPFYIGKNYYITQSQFYMKNDK